MTISASQKTRQFINPDLDWFSLLGHDRNPLHLNESYAQKTPFGERVVHGVLAALTALSELRPRVQQRLRRVVFEFPRPIFTGIDYTIRVEDLSETKSALTLTDGTLLVVRGMAEFAEGRPLQPQAQLFAPFHPQTEPRDAPDVDLQPGLPLVIPFGVTHQAYSQLEAHFGLSERGMGLGEVASLVGTSYVIGMSIALCNDW